MDVSREIAAWVEGITDVPFEKLLKPCGIALELANAAIWLSGLGIKTRARRAALLKLANVLDGGSAQHAPVCQQAMNSWQSMACV